MLRRVLPVGLINRPGEMLAAEKSTVNAGVAFALRFAAMCDLAMPVVSVA